MSQYSNWGLQIRVNPKKYYKYKIYEDGKYLARRQTLAAAREYIDEIINTKILKNEQKLPNLERN